MKWTKMPNESGWWFFTKYLGDWDLSNLISIYKHDYGCGKIEFRESYKERRLITSDWGFWYGPFRVKRPKTLDNPNGKTYIYITDD